MLARIREMEEQCVIRGMATIRALTTALDSSKIIMDTRTRECCEDYPAKPAGKDRLLAHLREPRLTDESDHVHPA